MLRTLIPSRELEVSLNKERETANKIFKICAGERVEFDGRERRKNGRIIGESLNCLVFQCIRVKRFGGCRETARSVE